MKKILTILLLLTLSVFADITWQKDIPAAFELAKKEHKPVMIFVEGEHCRWCKKMKHRTLSETSVEEKLRAFVTVKVFQEDSAAMSMLPAIKGVPTIFFMNADKTLLDQEAGYYPEEVFLSMIEDVIDMVKKQH